MAQIGHNAWAIAFAKCSVWVQNQNSKKNKKNDSTSTLELFCAKNGLKKHLRFENLQVFENGQNWSQCMGYSLCKMLCLGPKLKLEKTCEKRLYKRIRVVLCKKTA